jgi:hypothetical protein
MNLTTNAVETAAVKKAYDDANKKQIEKEKELFNALHAYIYALKQYEFASIEMLKDDTNVNTIHSDVFSDDLQDLIDVKEEIERKLEDAVSFFEEQI